MKITAVRACQPLCDSPPGWRTSLGQILVVVETDAGITGYGVGGGGLAAIHIVQTVLRDLLVDRNPEPVESLWQEMYDATLAFGRKGVAIMALSGVDLALWDLRGKVADKSVADLLGGVIHATMPTYTTVWDDIPESLVGQHSAFKIHLGNSAGNLEAFVDVVKCARQRVGPDVP